MKRQMALSLALAMVVASTAVEAQLGGLIRKKAGEVIGGKKPTPAPTPAAPKPDAAGTTPSTPPAPENRSATPAAAKTAVSPLDTSELPVRQSAVEVLRDLVHLAPNADWRQLPDIPAAAVAAAYALGESAQVALVETVGSALKTLVLSATFLAEHNQFIKSKHQAVDHGIKDMVRMEEALKKNDLKAIEAMQAREFVAMNVDQVQMMPADLRKAEFTRELAQWKTIAANPKRRDQAKFQKMVAAALPLEVLAGSDEKFLRGYAVIKSIENDGPDTEAAVFALHLRVRQEKEQLAYDQYHLKGQLKQQLTTFVAIAANVNFKAQTVEKGGKTVFVNADDERQGALWKACFRAGEAPTASALKLARAWLAEL